MSEIRIPYSLDMARARRAGIKTNTRRELRLQPTHFNPAGVPRRARPEGSSDVIKCPYGQRGDILLPVEPWRAPVEFDAMAPRDIPAGTPIWLDADGPAPATFGRYRHARFMPKALIKARDEVTEVRVERLHDISERDAIAEGWPKQLDPGAHTGGNGGPFDWYRLLWEQINGPGSWGPNPYVWVVHSKVLVP